jgi:glycosyltransferase involved in cell wall biosynthesis
MYKWVETINWDRVDKIILVSHAKQNEFNQRFPEQAHKTVVINVAVPLDKFTFEPHPYTGQIGTLCHITPRKRVYDLILDFYGLLQDQAGSATKFHLHIGGDIHPSYLDYSQAMQDLIERLGMRDAVTFHGKVTEPWNWYHQLDIFVSHSYSEGLQVAPMEAMASGCYCLSHHWAGAEEMLPVENLYVTGEELREKILAFDRLASEEQLAQRAASRAMAQQNFDVDKNKRLVRELIEQVGEKFLP